MDDDEITFFGESRAFYKLFNSAQGACFYFENAEPEMTLSSKFSFGLTNLQIVGEADDAQEFSLSLAPG